MPIRFFYEGIEFKIANPTKVRHWIIKSAEKERRQVADINYIFCSDQYLLKLNQDFLSHQTLTDIITFDYSEGREISGEIFVSLDRVKDNAVKYGVDLRNELHRVMIHGVLHLCGFKDKQPADKAAMRKKEDTYLSLWQKMFHVKRSR